MKLYSNTIVVINLQLLVVIQIKTFGSLVKGLRIGLDLLMILQQENMSSLSQYVDVPLLSGNNGLNELLTQFEAAVDSDFPKYQVCLRLMKAMKLSQLPNHA